MDCFLGKQRSNITSEGVQLRGMKEKVRLLQEEVKEIMSEKEKENRSREREKMVVVFKEAEWKQESKKLREEVKMLRMRLKEKYKWNRGTEKLESRLAVVEGKSEELVENWRVEQMGEERAWRDEAVDKWKKLYLAIKTELDDLLQIINRGDDGLYLKAADEEMIEELRMKVKSKEETIEELKSRLALLEQEVYKRAIEVDILRQSLRIMSSKKTTSSSSLPRCKPKFELLCHGLSS